VTQSNPTSTLPPPPTATPVAGGVTVFVPPEAARRPGREARAVLVGGRAADGRESSGRERGTDAARKQGRKAPGGGAARRSKTGLDTTRDNAAALDPAPPECGFEAVLAGLTVQPIPVPDGPETDFKPILPRLPRPLRAKGVVVTETAPAPFGDPRIGQSRSRTEVKRQMVFRLKAARGQTGSAELDGLMGHVAWKLDTCGSAPLPTAERVTLKAGEVDGRETRHLSGVLHCNRVLCPTCSAFITARRIEQLKPLAEQNADAGEHVFLTLTMRHRMGVQWGSLNRAVKAAWRSVAKRRRFGSSVLGGVRQDESTWGENGHHFHVHVLLTLAPGVNAAEFAQWFREAFEKVAQEGGRTCDWKDEWWSVVAKDRLASAVAYTQKAGGGLDHLLGAELLAGWAKHGSRLWDLPPDVYAEVWKESKRNRWFSSFGIWKCTKAEELEDEETLEAEREQTGQEERSVPVATWKLVPPNWLDWLVGVVLNRDVPRAEALRFWDTFWAAFAQTDTPTPSG